MAAGFHGLSVPWGQMSLLGGTGVIFSLFGRIPFIGPDLAAVDPR